MMWWRRALRVASVATNWTKTDFAFRSRVVTLFEFLPVAVGFVFEISTMAFVLVFDRT